MKVALLLPGYLDSPLYLHMLTFEKRLIELGYVVERLDLCQLWETGDVTNYTVTNSLRQTKKRVAFYASQHAEEILLLGHSNGAFISIIAGARIPEITKVIALCPPPDKKETSNKWIRGKARVSKRDLPGKPNEFREFEIPYSYIQDALNYSAVEEVKHIHKPLMIFIALDDVVVSPQLTEKIVANASKVYVVRQPGMGHDFRRSQEQCNVVMMEVEKFLLNTT